MRRIIIVWVLPLFGVIAVVSTLYFTTASPTPAEPPPDPAIPGWIKDLDSDQMLIREEAIEALAKAKAKQAVPRLEKMLEDAEPIVRRRAAVALWRIDGRTQPAMKALTAVVNDRTQPGRDESLRTLSEVDALGEVIGPLAVAMLADRDRRVKNAAAHIVRLRPEQAAPAILDALPKVDRILQLEMVRLLGQLGPRSGRTEAVLGPLLANADDRSTVEILATMQELKIELKDDLIKKLVSIASGRDATAGQKALQIGLRVQPYDKKLEPIYEVGLQQPSPTFRVHATEALWKLDRTSLKKNMPHLMDALRGPGREWVPTIEILERMGRDAEDQTTTIIKHLGGLDRRQLDQKQALLRLLGKLGDAGLSHLATVIRSEDATLSWEAVQSLAQAGPEAADHLAPLLTENDAKLRRAAFQTVSLMTEVPAKIRPRVIEGMNDPDSTVRGHATMAVAKLTPTEAEAVSRLRATLNDESQPDNVRMAAIQALHFGGPNAKPAAPDLRRAASSGPIYVRMFATLALAKIEGDTPQTRAELIALLSTGDHTLGWTPNPLLDCVKEFVIPPADVVKALRKGTVHGSESKRAAVQVIAKHFPTAEESLPLLLELLKDTDMEVRREAASALSRFGADGRAAIPILADMVGHKQADGKTIVIDSLLTEALARFGSLATESLPKLLGLWKHPLHDQHRLALASAIVAIDRTQAKEQLLCLSQLLRPDVGLELQTRAVSAIGPLDPKNPDLVPALQQLIGCSHPHIQARALEFLRDAADVRATEAVVLKQLKNSDPYLRLLAVESLMKSTAPSGELIQVLTDLLRHRTKVGIVDERGKYHGPYTIATRAARALGAIGPKASAATPELRKCLTELDDDLRKGAADALQRVSEQK